MNLEIKIFHAEYQDKNIIYNLNLFFPSDISKIIESYSRKIKKIEFSKNIEVLCHNDNSVIFIKIPIVGNNVYILNTHTMKITVKKYSTNLLNLHPDILNVFFEKDLL